MNHSELEADVLRLIIGAADDDARAFGEETVTELYELAMRAIEEVDHQVSADLDDFLATPEMAAEHERIRRLLAPDAGQAAEYVR
ncbi:hypothetical protein [Actinomadura sp. K4S16]|uniref:hypothetical protein n=1 Tax=Actinomadura sp. K4S16 TaxID=1316147 RepID=UPI0011EF51D8|nr:hypothetical protein [Actinomadura sp. K4S16]